MTNQYCIWSAAGAGGGGGGSGTVTSVALSAPSFLAVTGSPVTTNGTLALAYSGTALPVLNGGTGQTTASAAINALLPSQTAQSGNFLTTDGTSASWAAAGGGSGTVTSVALTAPSFLTVAGSPVTTSGTLAVTLATQSANLVFAGPGTGVAAAPTFRSLVAADIPSLAYVTSVAMTVPGVLFSVAGSPVTTSGTLALSLLTQTANTVLAGPGTGVAAAPTFRTLVAADIPSLSYVTSVGMTVPSFLSVAGSPVTGSGTLAVTLSGTALPILNGGTGQTTANAALNALLPSQATNNGKVLSTDGTNTSWLTVSGTGTVTSVALSDASTTPIYGVTGSPVTAAGTLTLTLATQSANLVFAGPSTGAAAQPTFRAVVMADLPANIVATGQCGSAAHAVGSSGTTLTVDFNNSATQTITLTGACTFTFSNPIAGMSYLLVLTQDATGSRTVTWPTVKWKGAAAPTLSTAANAIDIVSITYDGTNYYGSAGLNFG